MCGIVGFIGKEDGPKITIEGLKTLEYRGYDSWGIALVRDNNLEIIKNVGKLNGEEFNNLAPIKSDFCIGHTRWATHGSVTKTNAHPHVSNNNQIAVVHNGIIENFQYLRDFLQSEGYKFKTETDTEVIPILIEYYMKNQSFEDATKSALKRLEGSYAIIAIHANEEKLIGARNNSPLVFGIGDNKYFLASDVPAFLEHTNKVVFLEDEDFIVVDKTGFKLYNLENDEIIIPEIKKIEWNLEQAKLGLFDHFMIKEINEQKFTIKRAIEQDPNLINQVTDMINNAFGVFFVGCGTSYHACISASYLFSKVAKKHVNVVLASEFRSYEHFLTPKTLVIAVSQSGETADLLDAVKFAKKHHCNILSIVNVIGSTLTRISDLVVLMNSGPEICVLSTKSYTSQLAIFTLLAYSCADRLKDGKELIQKVCDSVDDIIYDSVEKLKELAGKIKDSKNMFLIGRDLAYPSALEGALKIKEVSYIHAEGFAGGELKHGTIALIDEGIPVIVFCTDNTRSLILSNAMEVKARGAYTIGIGSINNTAFDYFIQIQDFGDANPITMIIPVQILAYYLALERGCDPDHPRNLAKSCTVK